MGFSCLPGGEAWSGKAVDVLDKSNPILHTDWYMYFFQILNKVCTASKLVLSIN